MKTITTTYKKAMKQSLRNRSYAKVELQNINNEAVRDSSSWTPQNFASFSKFSTIDYGRNFGDTLLTLELNRWDLGKTYTVYTNDASVNDGVTTSGLTDSNGDISNVSITRTFSDAHTLGGFTIVFNTRLNEWSKVRVQFYVNNTVVADQTIRPTGTEARYDLYYENVTKVVVTPIDTLPYHRVQIERLILGRSILFENEVIKNIKQSHDVDPLSRRLPSENLSIQIIDFERNFDPENPSGLYDYIYKYAPISVSYGYDTGKEIEWLKPDLYKLNAQPVFKNGIVSFTALGLLGSMRGTYYKSLNGSKTLYDMAVDVLEDAGLDLTADGTDPWEIDDALDEMTTTAVLPITTHANCLQLIAHASCSRLYTDDDNVIHIKPFGVTKAGIYQGDYYSRCREYYSSFKSLDRGVETDFTYATLELNRWVLGTTNYVFINPNYLDTGYVSGGRAMLLDGVTINDTYIDIFTYPTTVYVNGIAQRYTEQAEVKVNNMGINIASDENGDIHDVWVERTFEVKHDLAVINLSFDRVLEEYPIQIAVKYYEDDVLITTETVDVDDTEIVVESASAVDINKIRIEFIKTLPYYRVRLNQVSFRETSFNLTFSSIKEDSLKTTKIDILKDVEVVKYVNQPAGGSTVLFQGTVSTNTLHVEFDKPATDISVSVSTGTVTAVSYAQATDLTFSATGNKTVTITGKYINTSKTTKTYSRSYTGEVDTENNQLITSDELADTLADHIADYLEMRNTYDLSYRGNPELEVNDIIGVQTHFMSDLDALVITDEIDYDGGLSGSLKLKGLI